MIQRDNPPAREPRPDQTLTPRFSGVRVTTNNMRSRIANRCLTSAVQVAVGITGAVADAAPAAGAVVNGPTLLVNDIQDGMDSGRLPTYRIATGGRTVVWPGVLAIVAWPQADVLERHRKAPLFRGQPGSRDSSTRLHAQVTQASPVSLTADEQEDRADQVRREFVEEISPETYTCFLEEQAEGRRDVFDHLVYVLKAEVSGQRLPDRLYEPCMTVEKYVRGTLARENARGALMRGIRKGLETALRRAGQTFRIPSELDGVLGRAVDGAAAALPRSPEKPGPDLIEDSQIRAEDRMAAAEAIVRRHSGSEGAVRYRSGSYSDRAILIVEALKSQAQSVSWDAPALLEATHRTRGEAGLWQLDAFYLRSQKVASFSHPDVVGWRKMTTLQRSDAYRRKRVAELEVVTSSLRARGVAGSQIRTGAGWDVPGGDPAVVILREFGEDGVKAYHAALASGDKAAAADVYAMAYIQWRGVSEYTVYDLYPASH